MRYLEDREFNVIFPSVAGSLTYGIFDVKNTICKTSSLHPTLNYICQFVNVYFNFSNYCPLLDSNKRALDYKSNTLTAVLCMRPIQCDALVQNIVGGSTTHITHACEVGAGTASGVITLCMNGPVLCNISISLMIFWNPFSGDPISLICKILWIHLPSGMIIFSHEIS